MLSYKGYFTLLTEHLITLKEDGLIMAQTKDIRNVCLMSHGNAGKTSLVEAMLYNAKLIDRLGKLKTAIQYQTLMPKKLKERFRLIHHLSVLNGTQRRLIF